MNKMKSLAMWLVIGVLGTAGVAGVVMALSGSFPIGIENCNSCTFNVTSKDVASNVEGTLGASGSRFPNGVSADTVSPITGQLRGTNLLVTGNVTSTGGKLNLNGLDRRVKSGALADATSTLFCVANPFLATSTVSARVQITNAGTSSWKLYVAPTTTSSGLAGVGQLDDNMLMEAALVATSSQVYVASGVTTGLGSFITSGGGTFTEVSVRPGDYVCGQGILDGGALTGMTNPLNVMAGTYSLEFKL